MNCSVFFDFVKQSMMTNLTLDVFVFIYTFFCVKKTVIVGNNASLLAVHWQAHDALVESLHQSEVGDPLHSLGLWFNP